MRENRIGSLDSLRAIAALGVLWIHAWTKFGNPRLHLFGVDITSILALGGNGVDLFFVISGFSIFYFYSSDIPLSFKMYGKFLLKRWRRLSFAFYSLTAVYIIWLYYVGDHNLIIARSLTSIFYLNSIFPEFNADVSFWSIGVEWQFYLIAPIIFYLQHKIGFKKALLFNSCLMGIISIGLVIVLKKESDIYVQQISFRYFEFVSGILLAKILLRKNQKIVSSTNILLTSLIITYLGRVFISEPILNLSSNYYNLFKLVGFLIMGSGFSGIIYSIITSKGYIKSFFENSKLGYLGRISYSFYLLHGIVLAITAHYFKLILTTASFWNPVIVFITCSAVLIPLSSLSYYLLEVPITKFKKR